MNDEEICQALDWAFQDLDLGLYFQVLQHSPYLYIFMNRPVGSTPDYDRITILVGETIAGLGLENFPYIVLYSRLLGEVEPDWEICAEVSDFEQETVVVNLDEKDLRAISNAAALSNTPFDPIFDPPFDETSNDESNDEITEFVSHRASQPFTDLEPDSESYTQDHQGNVLPAVNLEPEQDLNQDNFSQYCFVDDRNVLATRDLDISPKVAKALVIFHRFPTRGKHRVLPLLGQLLEGDRGIVFIHFPDQVQQWFEYLLTLTAAEIQGAKLWFSRYCQDSSRTLREMQALLKAAEAPSHDSPETGQLMAGQLMAGQSTAGQSIAGQSTDQPTSRKPPLLTIDARAHTNIHTNIRTDSRTDLRTDLQPLSATSAPPTRPMAQRSSRTSQTSQNPQKLWIWLVLLGVGSFCLGALTAVFYPQGLGMGAWIFVLLTIVLQTFSTATSNLVLQKVQGGIFTMALILEAVFPIGFVGGYIAGLLLGLGVGNILKLQFLNTQKSLPQNLAGVWELLCDRTGTIALAIALISFACPLILFTEARTP